MFNRNDWLNKNELIDYVGLLNEMKYLYFYDYKKEFIFSTYLETGKSWKDKELQFPTQYRVMNMTLWKKSEVDEFLEKNLTKIVFDEEEKNV